MGTSTNNYDGLDEDECYDISCEAPSCSCSVGPCDGKCTDRSDATCSFDCCTGIWYVYIYTYI